MVFVSKLFSVVFFSSFWTQCIIAHPDGGLRHSGSDHQLVLPRKKSQAIMDPHLGDLMSHMVKVVTPIIPKLNYNATSTFENNNNNQISLRRHLDIGDFEEINTILEGVVIDIPDQTVSTNLLFTLTLDIKKVKCFGFSIGDIVLDMEQSNNNQELEMTLDVIDLDLTCTLDYNYRYSFFSGSGSAEAYAEDSSAKIGVAFQSEDFGSLPPSDFEVTTCGLTIELDLDFRGDFVSGILDTFSDLIADVIEDELQGIGCSEITNSIAPLGAELIVTANELISPYLEPLSAEYADPLYPENMLEVPATMDLLDLGDVENELGSLVSFVLDTVRDFLDIGKEENITDVSNTTSTTEELKINEIIRDNLLKDRALPINISDFNLTDPDGVIYEGENDLTDTKITLQGLNIYGLDTFTTFDPVSNIGKHTLQSEVVLSYLEVEAALEIDVKPSTGENSLFESPGSERIIEQITIRAGVEDVAATLSAFLAIDQEKLESLTLGNLLDIDRLTGCLLSTIYGAQISGFNVTIGDIRNPITAGFVSVGIERILDNLVDSLLIMYEAVLLEALPNVFQTFVRDTINNDLIGSYLDDPTNSVCVKRTKAPSFQPSEFFSDLPSKVLSTSPSSAPSDDPTASPSSSPSKKPSTSSPSNSPSEIESSSPTSSPILDDTDTLDDPESVELAPAPIQQAPPGTDEPKDDEPPTLSPDAFDWLQFFNLTEPPNTGSLRRRDGP